MSFYKTGDFLPTYNFFKIIETDNYSYMLKLPDYEDLQEPENKEELKEIFLEIYSEYLAKDKSGGTNTDLLKHKKLSVLKNEYAIITGYLFMMNYYYTSVDIDFDNIKKELSKYGYNLKFENISELSIQLEIANKRASGILNRINSLSKGLEKKSENEDVNIFDIIAPVQRAYGMPINIHTTSIFEFLSIKNNCLNTNKDG